ncbi:hypothetical protein [Saccharopolyspora rectivirgula]|mgnify:CR=1 FL=1|uniref:hypothetical protein n=1 Tax=Saccharopolyspora rectivirgula TaxID=28042 RepID=UPI001F254982|nr:hypothetical protein [Saccharopolyspora rectivirgula]
MAELVAGRVLFRLREWGVEHVFAYGGDGIDDLLDQRFAGRLGCRKTRWTGRCAPRKRTGL